jgi:uncharacterized protein (DUF924 family)
MMDPGEPSWVGAVLRFWFDELAEAQWFAKSDALDAQIRDRFLLIHTQLLAGEAALVTGPRPMLAAIIVLDQFSRNMFRNEPRAFAADPIARRIAREVIAQGIDRTMSHRERLFLYLPFQHSEDAADQTLALDLMTALNNPAWTRFAIAHKQIIDRFGRFPHRNAVLGRQSTPEEIEMLKGPMSSF